MSLYQELRNTGMLTSNSVCEVVDIVEKYIDVDKIANHIRTIDGNNTMGAGELAEKIVEFIKKEF